MLIITRQIGVFLYFLFMLGMAVYSVSKAVSARAKLRPEVIQTPCIQIADFYPTRPQKVAMSHVTEARMVFPRITLCPPAFFSKQRWAGHQPLTTSQ